MKTTLDLEGALPGEAKAAAARRRVTLRAMVEHALRRELMLAGEAANPDPEKFEPGSHGFLVLKRKPGDTVTLEAIAAIQAEVAEADFQRAIAPRRR